MNAITRSYHQLLRALGAIDRALGRLVRYPLLTSQIALYLLVAWGVVGGELGASDSFWHEWWWSQLFVGAATCWLFGVVVFVSLLLLPPRGLPGLPTETGPQFLPGAWFSLLPSRNPGVRRVGRQLLLWLLGLLLVAYLGKWVALHVGAYRQETPQRSYAVILAEALDTFASQSYGIWFLIGYVLSFLFGAVISYAAHVTGAREWIADRELLRSSFDTPALAVPTDPEPAARGPGVLNTLPASEVPLVPDGCRFFIGLPRVRVAAFNLRTIILMHAMAAFFMAVVVTLTALILIPPMLGKQIFTPGVILSLFLIILNMIGGLIAFRVRAPRLLGALVVGWLVFANSSKFEPYTMTYDHIAGPTKDGTPASYDNPLPLDGDLYRDSYSKRAPADGLIDGKALLEKFRAMRGGKDGPKPRLVVVAVSGGGIRASVWTGVVLEGLEREFDGTNGKPVIRDHMRVFAGASGGMVGAGAYVANFGPEPLPQEPRDPQTGLLPFSQSLARDALSPTAQTMFVRDFTTTMLYPRRVAADRGRTLEDAWDRNFTTDRQVNERFTEFRRPWGAASPFRKSVRSLRAKEELCERPSVVFAPMMVEDSKRLFISNLNLDSLTIAKGHRTGEPPRPAPAPPTPLDLDLPGVEFFRLFPDSKDFTVGSAARMSATFPVISPAVAIPVKPLRRVVDAGYFDNYGIDVLAQWLLHHRKAVTENTSGVLLIQIRAYPIEADGLQFQDESPSPALAIVGAVSAPLQALLTVRGMGAYHRNNELLGELHTVFNAGERPDFFTTVVFEQKQEAALSWFLTTPQKKQVAAGFHELKGNEWQVNGETREKLAAVAAWFRAK